MFPPAGRATRGPFRQRRVVQPLQGTASKATPPPDVPVQLEHVTAAGLVVKSVAVLRYERQFTETIVPTPARSGGGVRAAPTEGKGTSSGWVVFV